MRRGLVPLVSVVVLVSVALPAGGAAAGAAATQEQVTLTVSVISQGGAQIGGITITATWDGGETTTTTASNGRAFVDVPRGADVSLSISSDRFVRNFPVTVEDASTQELTVEVARKGSATVRAVSPNGPVESATVELRQDGRTVTSGQTNENGAFTTGTIEQGRYTLEIGKPTYFTNETEFDVRSEGVQHRVEMRTGSVRVEVRVRDDHFEEPRPVNDASVEFGDVGTARTTGGGAVFAVSVNTRHTVRATKDGYETARTRYSVGESSGTIHLSIQREPALVVRPANERIVVGESTSVTVVDAYGEPIGDATVSVDGEAVARTDGSGQARITIESAGNHTVGASTDGIDADGVTVIGVAAGEETATPAVTPVPTTTVSPTPTPVPTTTSVSLPGFGPAVAASGVLLAALLLARRDR
ncbi:MAG: PGF-CTERM sorting domain-containing protein [Haloarculaceae archaeon]